MENCNLAAQCSLPYRTSVRLSVPPFGDREQNTESGVVVVVACERLVRPSVRPLRRRRPSRRRSVGTPTLFTPESQRRKEVQNERREEEG